MLPRFTVVGIAALVPIVVASSFPANAVEKILNFCNKSNVRVNVAYGYEPEGHNYTQTKGWRNLDPCQCDTLFSEDVRATEAYYYVHKSGSGAGDAFNVGNAPLCVRSGKFQVGPSNVNQKRCTETGGLWVNFTQVNVEKKSLKVNFGSGAKCIE